MRRCSQHKLDSTALNIKLRFLLLFQSAMAPTWEFVRTQSPALPEHPEWWRCGQKVNDTLNSTQYNLLFINGGEDGLYKRKYYFAGDLEPAGCRIFHHCRNEKEYVLFRPILNKIVALKVLDVTDAGQARIEVMNAFAGTSAGEITVSLEWTIGNVRTAVSDSIFETRNAILKFVSFTGNNVLSMNSKVKKLVREQQPALLAEPASKKPRI